MDRKKSVILTVFILFLHAAVYAAAVPVDFYATESTSSDHNMVTMIQDLFYTQIQTLDGYTVRDHRTTQFSEDASAGKTESIAFYTQLQEAGTGGWICTLNAENTASGQKVSLQRNYDSYYKILLDAKSCLESLFSSLSASPLSAGQAETAANTDKSFTAESLAGIWGGEPLADKIILMRGGRGFVIYHNGASMNVSVSIEGTKVTITQTSHSNASFYPELPRDIALQSAVNAAPVEWHFTLTAPDTLSGTKNTLIASSSGSGAEQGTISVEWKRR